MPKNSTHCRVNSLTTRGPGPAANPRPGGLFRASRRRCGTRNRRSRQGMKSPDVDRGRFFVHTTLDSTATELISPARPALPPADLSSTSPTR